MAGFNYTPPRPIQYRDMNPLKGLAEGVATGMQLGGMMQKNAPSDVVISDPGTAAEFHDRMLSDEKSSLEAYKEYYKKTADMDPTKKNEVYQELVNSGKVKSKIIAKAMENGMKPKEVEDILRRVQNNDPNVKADLKILEDKVGKDVVQGKLNQMKTTRSNVLLETLKDIDAVLENPMQFGGKTGRINPETARIVRDKSKYVEELFMVDPEAAKKYLEEKGQKGVQRGGGKPTDRTKYIDTLQKFYLETRYTAPKLAQQALEMRKELFKRPGPPTYQEMQKIQRILETPAGETQKLKVGKIYKDAQGNRAKYKGEDKNGRPIWVRV